MCKPISTFKQPTTTVCQIKVSRKRPRTNVRFNEQISSAAASEQSSFNKEDVKNLWYQKTELTSFKLEVRDYLLGMKISESRGFEKYHLDRAQNKALALKCTIIAAHKGYDNEELALIAEKCTASAKEQAFVTACEDYIEAYEPSIKKRRFSYASEQQQRRVRMRTC